MITKSALYSQRPPGSLCLRLENLASLAPAKSADFPRLM
jgi:hypothetical protein